MSLSFCREGTEVNAVIKSVKNNENSTDRVAVSYRCVLLGMYRNGSLVFGIKQMNAT
jgi:hypothetical protein